MVIGDFEIQGLGNDAVFRRSTGARVTITNLGSSLGAHDFSGFISADGNSIVMARASGNNNDPTIHMIRYTVTNNNIDRTFVTGGGQRITGHHVGTDRYIIAGSTGAATLSNADAIYSALEARYTSHLGFLAPDAILVIQNNNGLPLFMPGSVYLRPSLTTGVSSTPLFHLLGNNPDQHQGLAVFYNDHWHSIRDIRIRI